MKQEDIIELMQQNPELIKQAQLAVQQKEGTEKKDEEKPNSNPSMSIVELLSMPHIQGLITLYLKNSGKQFQWDIVLRYGLAFTAIVIAGVLGYYDKMDSTMGVLIGSVLGYMFGRKEG